MATNRDRKSFGSRRKKKFQKLLRRLAPLTFLVRVQSFGTHYAESFRVSKSSWTMDPTRSREMPSCSAIDLAEIRRSSKISSWMLSIISGVVTVFGRPGRGASQVEKSPRLNWSTQFYFFSLWRLFRQILGESGSTRGPKCAQDFIHCPIASKTVLAQHIS